MTILEKSIKHFEGLQKRYTTQHNGEMCQMVECALDSMKMRLIKEPEYIKKEPYGTDEI